MLLVITAQAAAVCEMEEPTASRIETRAPGVFRSPGCLRCSVARCSVRNCRADAPRRQSRELYCRGGTMWTTVVPQRSAALICHEEKAEPILNFRLCSTNQSCCCSHFTFRIALPDSATRDDHTGRSSTHPNPSSRRGSRSFLEHGGSCPQETASPERPALGGAGGICFWASYEADAPGNSVRLS